MEADMDENRHVHVTGLIEVRDVVKWRLYKERVPRTIAAWGGEVVLRGERGDCLDGASPFTEMVLIRFPDISAARGWHASPDYQALVPLRREAADVTLAVITTP
jgi:uncharacterized protein (DUF1330 family)